MPALNPTESSFLPDPRPVPKVILERFRRGELPPHAMRNLKTRYESDLVMREDIAKLAASDFEILASVPPEIFVRQLRQRETTAAAMRGMPSPIQISSRAWVRPAFGFALAALIALPAGVLYLRQPGSLPPVVSQPENSTERIKGLDPKLALFRKAQRGAIPLHPGDAVVPGSILRIGYHSAGMRFGAILSCDGNGQVTTHFPMQGGHAAVMDAGESLLPTAYELDAAPDYERFFLVTSDSPFALDPLRKILAQDRDLKRLQAAHPTLRAARFDVRKESPL